MRDHDELLRRYLLGGLDEEERNRLEERLLREEDLFEMAEAVEADLLDDYARGTLSPDEREQVAQRLASSPRGRSRLALIQGLQRIARERNVVPFPSIRRETTRRERFAALAAMLAIAVVSAWLATTTLDPVRPPRIADTPAPVAPSETARPVPPVTPPQTPEEVVAETTPPETPAPRSAAPWVVQLALGTLRGPGEIPQRNVPPEAGRVELHLQLDEADRDHGSFQVTVRGAGPELRASGLEPRKIDGRWTLVVDLDPQLPEGIYEVEVFVPDEDGPIAYKELEILRNASAAAATPE